MLKILIVEDEQQKKQLITKAICDRPFVSLDNLTFSDNARDAKKLISTYRFDLVVLDLNIPAVPGGSPELGAGLNVLSFIRSTKKAIAPGYIFGLTAYDEAFAAAVDAFESALWKMMRFSFSDASWVRALQSAVDYLNNVLSPPYIADGKTYHCDVGLAFALEEELENFRSTVDGWKRIAVRHDNAQYYGLSTLIREREVNIVATVASRMGMTNMAITSTKLINAFRPRLVASLGLCAGVRNKTEIGDILVADPCFDWGSGKWIRDTSKALRFLPAHYQWRLDGALAHATRDISADTAFLGDIHKAFPGEKPRSTPRVMLDAMASGASVLQVDEMMSDVREQHKNLIGVEMENYAIYAACHEASEPKPKCITVKSVCDFGDENKNDGHRKYASYTSGKFFWRLLQHDSVEVLLDA